MKRNIKLLLIMMIPMLMLSACIFSTTPPAGPVSVTWGQTATFKVYGMNEFHWFLDTVPVWEGVTYTFKSTEHVLGTYHLKVVSTFSMGGVGISHAEREWDITVTSIPELVPTATDCQDINDVGLLCDTATSCSPSVAEGEVITQSPAPGASVPAGSTVHLLLSSGLCVAHEVAVPAATGCASITAAGLICSTSTACSNEVPAGVVLSQSPPAGTMAMQGTTVSLVLSSGACTAEVEVPNATSCADVEAAGFICSRIRECSMTIPKDGVINQSPAPGMMAMPGSFVSLTISSGMCQATVPNATTCEEIEAEGLVCNLVTVCSDEYPIPGTFLSISPAPGTGIAPGSTVTLTKSNGPCTVVVPEAATCEEIISLSGGWLTCSVTYECNDTIPAGTKLGQNPAPGTIVTPGTAVELIICSGMCPVMLPAPTNVQASDVILTSMTNPMLNHNFNDKVRVTWTAAEGAQYYKVYRSNSAVGTYSYVGRTAGAETTYDDMQSAQDVPVLLPPPFPSLPSGDPATATANLNAYELEVRPIVHNFKNFQYYKVKAATLDPAYTDSSFSTWDEGRIDYTLEEFVTVVKCEGMGIPVQRMFIAASPIGLGTNAYYYDACGDGYMNLKIELAGLGGRVTAVASNYVESLWYNEYTHTVDCSPSKRKLMITNVNITGTADLSMNGEGRGSGTFTGNYAGRFDDIILPIVDGDLVNGTTDVVYNGETFFNHPFSL